MDLRQLEYLVALADEQSFTRAAVQCHVSQSGLSAAIRRLETEIGAPLFERTTRIVSPTAAGLAFLPHAREILAGASAGRDAVVRASHQLSGELRVGSEQCLGAVDVGSLLERFHRRHPGVDIQFVQTGSHDLVDLVHSGALDIAFVATGETPSTVTSHELGRRPMVLLVPSGHTLAARSTVSWTDLRDEDFVDFRPSWGVRRLNDEVCAARGIDRHVACSVDDVHTLIDLVRRGLGIALAPSHVAQKRDAATLVSVPLPAPTPQWIVSAILGAAGSLAPRLLEIADEDRRADEPERVA